MARFSTAPVEDVIPPRRTKAPSNRTLTRLEYLHQVVRAVQAQEALVATLEPQDKALTVRNRLTRTLYGLYGTKAGWVIQRRGNRIIVYHASWLPE